MQDSLLLISASSSSNSKKNPLTNRYIETGCKGETGSGDRQEIRRDRKWRQIGSGEGQEVKTEEAETDKNVQEAEREKKWKQAGSRDGEEIETKRKKK